MNKLRDFEQEILIGTENLKVRNERVSAPDYIEFLTRTDLGKQYPREDFPDRISALVQNVQVSLVVRNGENSIVGICFGLTDFAFWLFLTDLGIDKRYERKGLGKRLVEVAHLLAGGEKKIVLYVCAHDDAIPFYLNVDMKKAEDVMVKDNIEWTSFEVKNEFS